MSASSAGQSPDTPQPPRVWWDPEVPMWLLVDRGEGRPGQVEVWTSSARHAARGLPDEAIPLLPDGSNRCPACGLRDVEGGRCGSALDSCGYNAASFATPGVDTAAPTDERTAVVVKVARLVASEPALGGWSVVAKLRAAIQGLDLALAAGTPQPPEPTTVPVAVSSAARMLVAAIESQPFGSLPAPVERAAVVLLDALSAGRRQPSVPDVEDGEAFFRQALAEHGRCTCPPDLEASCGFGVAQCALCRVLPEEWPCPTTAHEGYPEPAIQAGEPT